MSEKDKASVDIGLLEGARTVFAHLFDELSNFVALTLLPYLSFYVICSIIKRLLILNSKLFYVLL